VRYPQGIAGEFFFQKRAPMARPDWLEVAQIRFPSGRSAEEIVPREAAALAGGRAAARADIAPHQAFFEPAEKTSASSKAVVTSSWS
jgi:bifunctional non-homologous end joining protein LigD